ncbi:MAG: LysR family transcriptional regulator [Pseudomonadota bacterium]
MPRNLDLTALRSFVAVADTGGVTRAAGQLHLTQSAVSMQVKRLEEMLGQPLLDRAGRGVALTAQGEQLLSYARRMLRLNDEVWGRMTDRAYEGEIAFGVPHDIVYPHVPAVLRRFAAEYPRVKVRLISSFTRALLADLDRGAVDLILTTEDAPGPGGAVLQTAPLVWFGAPGGQAWRARPVRLAFENGCIFRGAAQAALDADGIAWEAGVTSESTRTIEATVSADLAIHAGIEGSVGHELVPIRHAGALPELPVIRICLYTAPAAKTPPVAALAAMVRDAYGVREATAA